MDKKSLKRAFYQVFGREDEYPAQLFFAPGRVCLIGEHIDYNGGLVMPAAISRGIYAVYRREDNDIIWMRSTLDKKDMVFPLSKEVVYEKARGWGNYPLGVIKYLLEAGVKVKGCEILFHSNLPVGAGLSSSAAVEVLTAYLFSQLDENSSLDKTALAQLAKRAENEFIGVQCGIMDQFAVANGRKNQSMVLNCVTLEYEHIPMLLADYSVVIMNTNKSRELTESKFNERASECATALGILQKQKPIQHLAEAQINDIDAHIKDPILKKRAMHVANENQRVLQSAQALAQGDTATFGSLLTASHRSLSTLYEVSGLELDALVNAALSHPACAGAKMTGAGFGGCAVAIVKTAEIADFSQFVLQQYELATGRQGDIFEVEIEDGVRKLDWR